MKNIFIWGTGYFAEHVYSAINTKECVVRGFIDSDKEKQGKLWNNQLFIYSPSQLGDLKYDFIILSMIKYDSAENNCKELGIEKNKVIPYWKDFDQIFRNRALEILAEKKNTKKYEYRLDSAPYEWGVKEVPKIEPAQNLLKKIICDGSSLCRFGDGEFEIMRGNNRAWFQKTSETLQNRLNEVINSQDEGINIAIAQNFTNFDQYKETAADEIRRYMAFETRQDILKMLDMNRTYYDAYITRPYYMYRDRKNADIIFSLFKKLWLNRNIIMVEGKYNRNGINNDLFHNTESVKRIICPSENAWSKYDSIKKVVFKHVHKGDLICIALGPTATVLAYDIAKAGYQAVDFGQVDNEYDWYIRGAESRVPIEGKLVAETKDNKDLEVFHNELYEQQIIDIIE